MSILRGTWSRVGLSLLALGVLSARAAGNELEDDPAAEADLLALVGSDGFKVHRTAHYLICYDTDEEVLRDFIARVEATYRGTQRFLHSHQIAAQPLERRLEILFFDTPQEFRSHAELLGADVRGAAGFYHPGSNRAAFYNALNTERIADASRRIEDLRAQLAEEGSQRSDVLKELTRLRRIRDRTIATINQVVVQHEVAHQVFFNAGLHVRGADNPPWLVEGLATLFEPPLGAQGSGQLAVNQYRLMSFREALSADGDWKHARADQFADACQHGRLVPLRTLVGEKSLFDTQDAHVEQRYAQAWSLMYYLQSERREDLGVYLTVMARRPSDRGYSGSQELQQFEHVFGPIDGPFEQRWLAFVLRQRVQPTLPER